MAHMRRLCPAHADSGLQWNPSRYRIRSADLTLRNEMPKKTQKKRAIDITAAGMAVKLPEKVA